MIEVEIIKEYKQCWRVGQRREVSDEFAQVLIEGGYAKRVEPVPELKFLRKAPRDKMVNSPVEAKSGKARIQGGE